MWNAGRRPSAVAAALLSLLAFSGCGGYQLAGSGPAAQEPGGESVPRAHKLSGDSLNLEKSGCPVPPESAFYVLDLLIDVDGTAKVVQFLKGTPTECIRGYVDRAISTWRFEPPVAGGQPTQLRYSLGFAAPAPSGP